MHFKSVQQLADHVGVSRRLLFQAAAVHRHGCRELVKAASDGVLAMKHCETLAKALPHDEQREFLAELPTMTKRQRHDLLAILKGALVHSRRAAANGVPRG
jgi:hypothetical protein